MAVIPYLKPDYKIHWLVKKEFAGLVSLSDSIDQVISFSKEDGVIGLIKLALKLRKEGYTHLYDAHSNIRSRIFTVFFKLFLNIGLAFFTITLFNSIFPAKTDSRSLVTSRTNQSRIGNIQWPSYLNDFSFFSLTSGPNVLFKEI